MKNIIIAIAFIVSAFSFESCARRVVVQEPSPRIEVIPARPSPRHVWVKGYYRKRHNRYDWQPGHYVITRERRHR